MITLFIGRHGETKLNSEERLRAWIDEPLNATGVKEAHAMGKQMKQFPIDKVYCSDLDRAEHTATIVAEMHDLTPMPRKWFRPLDYGTLSGKKIKDIQPMLDKLNEQWMTDPDVDAPSGESFASFQNRNMDGLEEIMLAAKDGEMIMIVAHLRNCLLFHGISVTGGPLEGEDMKLMIGDDFHQESGQVARYSWDNDTLKFVSLLDVEKAETTEKAIS